jgi:hypothetical protein
MTEAGPNRTPPTPEQARLGGIKSGETRRAKAEKKAEARALELFAGASEELAQELLDAALGRGNWGQGGNALLDPKERSSLLKTCLEYAVGRPRPMAAPAESAPEADTERKGIAFGVKAPVVPLPHSAEVAEAERQRAAEEH